MGDYNRGAASTYNSPLCNTAYINFAPHHHPPEKR